MSIRKRTQIWFLLLSLLLLILLAACAPPEEIVGTPTSGSQETTGVLSPTGTPESNLSSQVPLTLVIQSELSPPLDPACLEAGTEFSLRTAPIANEGIAYGENHVFCATGAPEGASVELTVIDPAGNERSYTAISTAQGAGTVVPFSFRPSPNDISGDWLARASYGEAISELPFIVAASSRPFIALSEPVDESANVIRAGIGGLDSNATARFALYTLTDPRTATAEAGQNNAALLISTRLVADESGRADLELDIADLPAGPYLMLLIPANVDLGSPAVLQLPDQENLAVSVNLTRQVAPDGTITSAPRIPAPQSVATGGGLPDSITVNLPAETIPECEPTSLPSLQVRPASGQVGDWWHGCATGFVPGETLQFTVSMANGESAQFNITTGPDGTAPFRWYGAPGEGTGVYKVTAKAASGEAETSWTIDPATQPNALVFPLNFRGDTGGDLYLSGFPANANVQLALYRFDEQGNGVKKSEWQVTTNADGNYGKPFDQAFGLDSGNYAVIAQSEQAYAFPGIDVPASAVALFSNDTLLDPAIEYYTLFLGRETTNTVAAEPMPTEETATEVETEPAVETPVEPTTEPETESTPEVPPTVLTPPEDTSEPPSCPGATPGEPAICMLPTTLPKGTFGYFIMQDFNPGTRFSVVVTQPNGQRVPQDKRANADGFADAYWYVLNNEATGEYKVTVKGGGETYQETFQAVASTNPHIVIQPRTQIPGYPVIVSLTGFEPNEQLILARYRKTDTADGQMTYTFVDRKNIKINKSGGAKTQYATSAKQKGSVFLIAAFRPDDPTPTAQALYGVGVPLGVRDAFAWAQNYQEGQ